jgi:hypothetical protein
MSSNENQTTVPAALRSSDGLGAGDAPEASIWERRHALDKERREYQRKAMADFDRAHYAKLRALQTECGQVGHKWRFTHLGPLSDPWFSCGVCHASECRPERDSA